MDELVCALKTYFAFLESHWTNHESLEIRASKVLVSIDSLSERLQAASQSPDDIEIIQRFPMVRDAIVFKIFMSLEQQLQHLKSITVELEEATSNINNLLTVVDKALALAREENVDINTEVPSVPISIKQLLECALDCRQYFQAVCSQISIAVCCLDLRNSQTVSDLRKSFTVDKFLRKHVEWCLALAKVFIN